LTVAAVTPDGPGGRAAAMVASVRSAALAAGCPDRECYRVVAALSSALEPRVATLPDDHHPAYLHPGRSILILIKDVGSAEAEALVLAALLESEDRALRVPDPVAASMVSEEIVAERRAIPLPGDEALVERLVLLSRRAATAALAERLDHLRHYHLRQDLEGRWRERWDEVVGAWGPFAERTDPVLARRYAHWTRTFARRLG
jgi:hypothetical protein